MGRGCGRLWSLGSRLLANGGPIGSTLRSRGRPTITSPISISRGACIGTAIRRRGIQPTTAVLIFTSAISLSSTMSLLSSRWRHVTIVLPVLGRSGLVAIGIDGDHFSSLATPSTSLDPRLCLYLGPSSMIDATLVRAEVLPGLRRSPSLCSILFFSPCSENIALLVRTPSGTWPCLLVDGVVSEWGRISFRALPLRIRRRTATTLGDEVLIEFVVRPTP